MPVIGAFLLHIVTGFQIFPTKKVDEDEDEEDFPMPGILDTAGWTTIVLRDSEPVPLQQNKIVPTKITKRRTNPRIRLPASILVSKSGTPPSIKLMLVWIPPSKRIETKKRPKRGWFSRC